MKNDSYVGEMLTSFQKWIKKAAHAKTPEDFLKVNKAFTEEIKTGAFQDTKTRARLVSDFYPATATPSDPVLYELSVQTMDEGIRLSAFYGPEGDFLGWSYFDMGNIPLSEIRKHMSNFKTDVRKGRPQEISDWPLTDVEIFEKIETRIKWMPAKDGSEDDWKPTKREACERIISEEFPNKDPDDEELIKELLKRHHRVYRRRWKKSD